MPGMSTDASADSGKSEQDHFFRAAWIVAALTMLSRIFGMVRDMVLVPMARGGIADSFWIAFSIPHMFRRLFGEGALTAAFVPVFTESAEKAGWQRARLVLGNTLGLLAAVLAVITVVTELGLLAWLLLWPGARDNPHSIQLTMLMLPFAVGICLLALMSAALNAKGHFVYPAAAPMILNVGLIIGGGIGPMLAGGTAGQFYIEGIVLHVANLFQVLPALWLVRKMGLLGPVMLRPILPEIGAIVRKMAPTFIPLSMMQISEQLSKIAAMFLSAPLDAATSSWLPLSAGVVQCQYAAGRLYQFSMGVLGVSLSTAVFPLLTRYVARGDAEGLRQTIARALRLCFFLGIPSGAGMVALARPVVEAIFLRRHFTGGDDPLSDVSRTTIMLQMYCLGMPAYFVVHVLLRAFFARKETRGPMIVSSILGLATVLLTVGGFFTPLRHASMGLATAVVFSANAAIFGWMIQRRVGRLDWPAILAAAARVTGATAAMVAATLASLWWLKATLAAHSAWWMHHITALRVITVMVPLLVGAAVFVAAAIVLRCPELHELRRRKQPAETGEKQKKKD
jgi:putative peptidoglycan lipid II flippase